MDRASMRALIDQHINSEEQGDIAAAVAVYTPDVQHDVVGAPGGILRGPQAAAARYEALLREIQQSRLTETHSYFGDDFCVIEHEATFAVTGQFAGVPGHGREVTCRILHVFEFRDGLISRENVWMDTASVMAQLATGHDSHADRAAEASSQRLSAS